MSIYAESTLLKSRYLDPDWEIYIEIFFVDQLDPAFRFVIKLAREPELAPVKLNKPSQLIPAEFENHKLQSNLSTAFMFAVKFWPAKTIDVVIS